MQILKRTTALTIFFATALCTHAETPFTLQPAQNAKKAPTLDNHGDPLPPGAVARLGTLRWRQKASGGPLVFSRDGKRLYSLDSDGNLHDWNRESGKLEGILSSPQAEDGRCLAISPDGKYLAAADGKRVKVWDLVKGGEPRLLEGQGARIRALDFAPDSRSLVSVADDDDHEWKDGQRYVFDNPVHERIFVWAIDTGKIVTKLGNQLPQLSSIAFVPDGKHVVIGSGNGQMGMGLVNMDSGKMLWTAHVGGFGIEGFKLSPDGKTLWAQHLISKRTGKNLATGWDLLGWDVATGRPKSSSIPVPDSAGEYCMSTDGRYVFVSNRKELLIHDADSGKTVAKFDSPGRVLGYVAVSRDGKYLAATAGSARVFLWDLKSGKRLFTEDNPDAWVCLSQFLPDNKTILCLNKGAEYLSNLAAGTHSAELPQNYHGRLWIAATGASARQFVLNDVNRTGLIALSPDCNSLTIGGQIWDVAKGELRRSVSDMGTVKFSPDGKILAAFYTAIFSESHGGAKSKKKEPVLIRHYVGLFDSTTGQRLHQIHFTDARSGSLVFSQDGKRLLVADSKTLLIWDIPAAKELLKLEGKQGQPHCFTPHAAAFVESHGPAGYLLKSSTTGKALRKLALHPAETFEAVAPDGKTAIFRLSGAQATAISLRDLTTGKKLAIFDGQYGNVTSASFSPDGTHIVVGYSDSTALVWDIKAVLRSQPAPTALKAQELDQLWKDLGSADEAVAITALDRLAAAPEQALPLVAKQVSPLPKVNIDRLIADLDSDSFAKRDKATKELAQQEFAAAKATENALAGTPTLEMRQRLQLLLKKLEEPITSPELLASWRAVIVLEQIATPDAQKMLQSLANGAPEARLTEEASAAMKRLQK